MQAGSESVSLNPDSSSSMFPAAEELNSTSEQSSGYIRLRGLPFSSTEADVQAFFRHFAVSEVFLCKRNGRCTGEAFVQLANPNQTQAALEALNRQHIGPRYIELFQATAGDLVAAKASTADRLRGYVIRMRGLPYTASAADVLRFLDGMEVVRGMEGVIFTWTSDGRPTGEAFVELKDQSSQVEAMKRHKQLMGTRYIELFISTKAALVQAIQHNRFILGYANRRRWLQQACVPSQVILPQQHSAIISQPLTRLDEVTDSFAGMSMSSQGLGHTVTHVIGPGAGSNQPGSGILMSTGASGLGHLPTGRLQSGATVRTAMPLMQADVSQQGQAQMGTYIQGQGITTHGTHPTLGLQQVQVIQAPGYRRTSNVVAQPYIIQQAPSQYVTVSSPTGFGTTVQTVTGPGNDGNLNRGPYGGVNAQNQPLCAVQLPAGSNVQEYFQLGNVTSDLGQGAGSASVTPTAYIANMTGLHSHMHSSDGTTHVLHP